LMKCSVISAVEASAARLGYLTKSAGHPPNFTALDKKEVRTEFPAHN